MFDHLLELSHRDDSNKWSNIGFGEEITQVELMKVNSKHLIMSSAKLKISSSYPQMLTSLFFHQTLMLWPLKWNHLFETITMSLRGFCKLRHINYVTGELFNKTLWTRCYKTQLPLKIASISTFCLFIIYHKVSLLNYEVPIHHYINTLRILPEATKITSFMTEIQSPSARSL